MEKWTEKEVLSAEMYYNASEKETSEETFEYISDMMYAANYPKRTANAYKNKLYNHCRNENT